MMLWCANIMSFLIEIEFSAKQGTDEFQNKNCLTLSLKLFRICKHKDNQRTGHTERKFLGKTINWLDLTTVGINFAGKLDLNQC